ncbi:MAG: HepT-like ribonuclease domain-containing protein [Tessaracoccus sp.]
MANQYASDEDLDQLVIDAICLRLSKGIKVLARLDSHVRSKLFGDNWQFMWEMRNRIAHGYLLVDADIVRRTTEIDLPDILRMIRREVSDI